MALESITNFETTDSIRELVPGEVTLETMGPKETFELRENMETPGVFGNPEAAAEVWHLQEHPMSCAVVCQEFIAEELLGKDFSEAKMRDYAEDREWFSDGGTKIHDVGNLLEEMGLDVERVQGATVEDIKAVLTGEGKLMAGVNNLVLHDSRFALLPGNSANHMVEVTGIDERDPNHVKVILNDPGVENGAGREVPLDTFLAAWNTSGNFMVSAYRPNGGAAL